MSDASAGDTRWSVIREAARGDGQARSLFARSYLPVVRGFFAARWGHGPHAADIDDAMQETFVECFRDGGTLARAEDSIRDFRRYLFGIVRHIAHKFEARRGITPVAGALAADAVEAREQHLSAAFDDAWARAILRMAGELMRSRAQASDDAARRRLELLRLRFEDGLSIREIAARWETEADAVHRAYARARSEFHACLRAVVREHAVRTEDDLDVECRRLLATLR